jgi:hypothetical protein
MRLLFSRTAPLRWTRTSFQVWGGCGWGVIPTRGAAAYQIAGDTLDIGPIMDIGPTGGITFAAGTIHIGVTEVGIGTDAESETKPYKKRNSRLTIPL